MRIAHWAAALLAALIVVPAMAAMPAQASSETAKPRKKVSTVVSLTFDDGDVTHLAVARMLEKRKMRGTFYINTETIGDELKLTRAQVASIAKGGHEIGGHTLTHARLSELLPSEQRVQICDDRRTLAAWGYRATTPRVSVRRGGRRRQEGGPPVRLRRGAYGRRAQGVGMPSLPGRGGLPPEGPLRNPDPGVGP